MLAEPKPVLLKESNYFRNGVEMHYALLQTAENIGPRLHTHEFFEIFLLTEGQIRHVINGKSMVLSNGTLTFIRPSDAHYFRPVRQSDCQMINLAVSRGAISDLFVYLGDGFPARQILEPILPPEIKLTRPMKLQTQTKFEQLNAISPDETARKQTALRIFLFDLATQFVQLTTPYDTGLPNWLAHACEQMQEKENFVQGVPKMTELASVSAEHLSRTMKRYLDQTPTQFINQVRLNFVVNQLVHGDRPIIDIAADAGFLSLSYFYKLFKNRFEMSPNVYREQHLHKMP